MNASYTIEYRLFVRPEDFSPHDNFDHLTAADILESAESNVWAWAAVEVQAVAVFAGGAEVIGSDFLGGCSYGSENEFRAGGSYFEDMKIEALSDLMGKL